MTDPLVFTIDGSKIASHADTCGSLNLSISVLPASGVTLDTSAMTITVNLAQLTVELFEETKTITLEAWQEVDTMQRASYTFSVTQKIMCSSRFSNLPSSSVQIEKVIVLMNSQPTYTISFQMNDAGVNEVCKWTRTELYLNVPNNAPQSLDQYAWISPLTNDFPKLQIDVTSSDKSSLQGKYAGWFERLEAAGAVVDLSYDLFMCWVEQPTDFLKPDQTLYFDKADVSQT